MITRLYVNNFRCLVNFKAEFDSFAVLCGPNGAGKSSVFDALRLLRNLGTGDALLGGTGEQDVPRLEFPRWDDNATTQQFELSLSADGYWFDYLIHIEQKAEFEKPRIISEKAHCDGSPLFERDLDGVRIQRADGNQSSFPLDWRQSALAAIQPRGSIAKLTLLQAEVAKLFILRPNPRSMEPESKSEARHPDLSMTNLTSWYRSLYQDDEWRDALRDSLKNVWPDLLSFKLEDVGLNAKALQLRFEHESGEPILLFSGKLSDGERMLIALYMVRAAIETGAARTVFIDEPDNFVGMPELQPWVLSMRELLDEKHQLVLISHHPEILSNSGEANGRYLWRDSHTSPTRIGPLKVPDGMTAGEAIARGWASGE
ncbi:MAG TPA: ATP-binding protein [Tepidisphaeraceae bacterium]|nr:ATP-binding protein [Tepidisphaeraceae bacterium]